MILLEVDENYKKQLKVVSICQYKKEIELNFQIIIKHIYLLPNREFLLIFENTNACIFNSNYCQKFIFSEDYSEDSVIILRSKNKNNR